MIGIEGNNLFLAKVEETNLQQIYEWKNDLSLLDLVKSHSILSSFDDVKDWYHRNTHDKNQVLLSINTLDSKIIGIARLMFIDWISRTTELGIYLGRNEYKGKSYGTEATSLIIRYAFDRLNLRKIYLRVLESNLVAIKLYKGLGFETEGCQKEHFWVNGKYENVFLMGLIKK